MSCGRAWRTWAPSCSSSTLPRGRRRPRRCPRSGEPTYADKLDGRGVRARLGAVRGRPRPRRARPATPSPARGPPTTAARLKIWRARPLSASVDEPPGTVFGHTRVATGEGRARAGGGAAGRSTGDGGERVAGRPPGADEAARLVSGVTRESGHAAQARRRALEGQGAREAEAGRRGERRPRRRDRRADPRSTTAPTRTSCCRRCCRRPRCPHRDRAFTTDLVYGTVRAQRRLDDLLGHVVKRPAGPARPAGPRRAAARCVPTARRHAAARRGVGDRRRGRRPLAARARVRQRQPPRAHPPPASRGPNRRATRSRCRTRTGWSSGSPPSSAQSTGAPRSSP